MFKKKEVINARGTRDFDSDEVCLIEFLISKIKNIFTKYDAVPIETPIIERFETVENLYGSDFNKLVYTLNDPINNEDNPDKLLLRYDLTVSFARYIATKGLISFKAYRIGKVYRRDKPHIKKGRYREFYQCDFDIVGTDNGQMLQELEILSLLDNILKELLPNKSYKIQFNSRQILYEIIANCGIPESMFKTVASIIDKLDKLSLDQIKSELENKGLENGCITKLVEVIVEINNLYNKSNINILNYIKDELQLINSETYQHMFDIINNIDKNFIFNPCLARGLDYYTGLIYEATYSNSKIMGSSIAGGGRYDDLIGFMSNKGSIPAIGLSIGLNRILTIYQKEKDLYIPPHIKPKPKVYIASVGGLKPIERIKLCNSLRKNDIYAITSYSKNPKMRSQLNTIFERKIPYMITIGPKELERNTVMLKTIETKEQKEINRIDMFDKLKY